MTVNDIIEHYVSYIETYMAAKSVKTYRSRLGFLSQRIGAMACDKVEVHHLTNAIKAYRDGRSNSSTRLFITTVKEVFRYAHNAGAIDRNPALYLRAPRVARRHLEVLGEWQVNKLLEPVVGDWRDRRNQALLVVFLYTGVRREEAAMLTWEKVSFQEAKMTVAGKGSKQRVIPLHKEVMRHLQSLYKERRSRQSPYVFCREDGGRLHTYTINCIFRRWVSKKKEVECTPHQLRHAFATRLIVRGVKLELVRDLLGHDSVKTTELYVAAVDTRRLRGAVDVL